MRIISRIIAPAFLLFINSPVFAQLNPLVIGTMNPGDSIMVYYDVAINANAGTVVMNQGNIRGTGIALVSDDPDTGLPDDATITVLYTFPLPVHLLDISAVGRTSSIALTWKVTGEEDMISYEVERSSNGSNFVKIGEVAARNNSAITSYAFMDPLPYSGANFYRLRMVDGLGAKYSMIVRVNRDVANSDIRIFPNPIANSSINLQLNNMAKGNLVMLLINNMGQVVHRMAIHHEGGSSTKSLVLPPGLTKGVYSIKVMHPNVVFSRMLLIQ